MWISETFGKVKPVIGMVHIRALPGTVLYDKEAGFEEIVKRARQDYNNLVEGGISGIIFCNEHDKPYSKHVAPHIIAYMTTIIMSVLENNNIIPFGVDVQWDPKASIAIAAATGGSFIRGIVCGTFCGDYGILQPDTEEIIKYRQSIGADNIRILTNLSPEFSYSLDKRHITLRSQTIIKSSLVDGICVSGVMAGVQAPYEELQDVKTSVGDFPVFANTGVNFNNIKDILEIADGCCVATCLKEGANPNNPIDVDNVKNLMERARRY